MCKEHVATGLRLDVDLPHQEGWKTADVINTGVPHVVVGVDTLSGFPVFEQGRAIRYHPLFQPAGTNANFVRQIDRDTLEVRTYERGVEDETFACGTGAIASALVASVRGMVSSPVTVRTRGGERLTIYFEGEGEVFNRVWLEGNTSIVCTSQLHEEAL